MHSETPASVLAQRLYPTHPSEDMSLAAMRERLSHKMRAVDEQQARDVQAEARFAARRQS